MSKLRLLALASVIVLTNAAAANAAGTRLFAGVSSPPRRVNISLSPATAAPMDLAVSGGTDGVLSFTDPGGVDLPFVTDLCHVVSSTRVDCGAVGDPVSYLSIQGSAQADAIDLSGLAAQATQRGPFQPFGAPAYDADERMRGIFAFVQPGDGADTILGGGASASYEPGNGDDTVTGGAGDELVRAGSSEADGDDTFTGGGGYDTMSYLYRAASVKATLSDTPGSAVASGATGTAENDRLSGVEGLTGGSGGDVLTIAGTLGGLGTLVGGPGADTLTGGPSTDRLEGEAGADELHGAGGDDYLADSRRAGEAQGHLDGGEGDDELVQKVSDYPAPIPDGVPTCGPGQDVLRADPGIDDGVSATAGPADCEVLANSGAVSVIGRYRVGSKLSVVFPPTLKGTPIAGRGLKYTWQFCSQTSPNCDDRRVTSVPELILGPGDIGAFLIEAWVDIAEPLSQAPRWVEERAALLRPGSRLYSPFFPGKSIYPADYPDCYQQYPSSYPITYPECAPGYPGATPTPTPGATPTPTPSPTPTPAPTATATPAPTPTPAPTATPQPLTEKRPVAPSAVVLTKLIAKAFGKAPKLGLLKAGKIVALTAPTGSRVTVRITAKVGKKTVLVARGAAIAVDGKVTVKLRPTRAGKALAKRGRRTNVTVKTVAVNAGGTATSTVKLTLRAP